MNWSSLDMLLGWSIPLRLVVRKQVLYEKRLGKEKMIGMYYMKLLFGLSKHVLQS